MSDRIIYIRRVEKNDRTRLPKDLLIDSKQSIGASFDKYGQVLKGVTGAEERAIMTELVGVSTNDPGFAKAVEMFWKNFNLPVPAGGGVKLNVGLAPDGSPVAPLDYIKYKFALKHKHVAPEEKVEDYQQAKFYIHDPVTQTAKKVSELSLRNEVKLKYLELIQDEKKMDAVISIMTSYRNPSVLTADEKQLVLEQESERKPKEFLKLIGDDKLMMKSFIHRAVSAGVITQSGNRVIYEDEILGEDIDSATKFLMSKEGSKFLVKIEGKLSQWSLNK
jgi:hypothetical protein